MIFIFKDNKELMRTVSKPIYKYETGVDEIKILIPPEYQDMSCVIQCLLPDQETGLYKYCNYAEELYKERLVVTIPITSAVTKHVGEIKIWLLFLKKNADDPNIADSVLKSSMSTFKVFDNGSLDSQSEEGFDEIWTHSSIDELRDEIDDKADTIEVYGNQLQLKSGDTILNTVMLSDDVTWKEWV